MESPQSKKKKQEKTNEQPEEIQEEKPEEAERSRVLLESRGYHVESTLGSGSYSTVKLVRKSGTSYACKIVSKELTSAVYRAKFLPRELKIVAAIRHPHITCVKEIIDLPSKAFIIMELATGGDLLEKILKVKRFKEKHAARYFMEMASALAYLHFKDIAHRDLKCENVLLTSTNHVKLADFSFARYCTGENGNPKELSATFCGSEAYAPPEVLQGVRYRPKKADMWSLGVILFVMVTGLLPYESECIPHQVRLQMTRTLRFPQVLPLSPQLKNLIRGMLEPVATLRSSMARVLRHPWVQTYSVAEVQARAMRTAKPCTATHTPAELPSERTSSNMHADDGLTASLEKANQEKSAIAQPEHGSAGSATTSASGGSSQSKRSSKSTSYTMQGTSMPTGRTSRKGGRQQSAESPGTPLDNRAPGRQKAKEDIAIKEPEVSPALETKAGQEGKTAQEADQPRRSSATSITSQMSSNEEDANNDDDDPEHAAINDAGDEAEDASGESAAVEPAEEDLSSALLNAPSTSGEASKVTQSGRSNESWNTATSQLLIDEQGSQSTGSSRVSGNAKPAMIIRPLNLPPSDFKPKGIMKS